MFLHRQPGTDLGTAAEVEFQKELNMYRFCSVAALAVMAASLTNSAFGQDRHRGNYEYGFGKKVHIETLANDLNKQSKAICWELHRYYQQNRNFDDTYKRMFDIYQGSERIATLAKEGYYRTQHADDQLARDLHHLDMTFDRIDAELRTWRANRRDNSRGRDLAAMMEECEDTLDHLMDDYGVHSNFRKEHARYGAHHGDRGHAPRP